MGWLTGYDASGLQDQIARETDFDAFFAPGSIPIAARSRRSGRPRVPTAFGCRLRGSPQHPQRRVAADPDRAEPGETTRSTGKSVEADIATRVTPRPIRH
jgi:hypothetical protein